MSSVLVSTTGTKARFCHPFGVLDTMEMPAAEEHTDGGILDHSDALSQASSHYSQMKTQSQAEGNTKMMTGKPAQPKPRDFFNTDDLKAYREEGSLHTHESGIPYISQAKLTEPGFELRNVDDYISSARSSRPTQEPFLPGTGGGYAVPNESFTMMAKNAMEGGDLLEGKTDIVKEALPKEMQSIVSEMDNAVDRLRKLYSCLDTVAEREKSNHYMLQAANSKKLKSQMEEMKAYIKKCDVEMGHLGKAITQRDQKLREMEIAMHSSETDKAAREQAMNEEIRALQMTIKELEHATYEAQKRAEVTRTLMEDIQHESEKQKEESKTSMSVLKQAAQDQLRKVGMKLEEVSRDAEKSRSEADEFRERAQNSEGVALDFKKKLQDAEKESHRQDAEFRKLRDKLNMVESVAKEEKLKSSALEENLNDVHNKLHMKEQLCGKYEDKIETLKGVLEEMNSKLQRESASYQQLSHARDLAHREIDRLRTESQSFKGEIAKLKEAYESSQMRVSRAESATESMKEEMNNALAEKQRRIESLQELVAKNDNTITQMNKRIQWAEEVMEKMKIELVNSRKDADEKNHIHQSKVQDLQRDLSQYKSRVERADKLLREERESSRSAIETGEKTIRTLKEETLALHDSLKTEKSRVKELEGSLSLLQNDSRQTISIMSEEMSTLRKSKVSLESNVASLKAHVQALEKKLEDSKREAEERVTNLANENSRLKSRRQEDTDALRSLQGLYRTEQETVSLKSEELAQAMRTSDENAKRAQEFEEELQMERSRLKQTESLLAAVREEVHKQSEERLQKYMAAYESERQEMSRKLQEAKEQNTHIVSELDSSRDREASAKATLRQMWSEMTTTRREMDDMRTRFAAAESAMKALVVPAPGLVQSSMTSEDRKYLNLNSVALTKGDIEGDGRSATDRHSATLTQALGGA